MAYRQPGVTVTEEFVNSSPQLAAFSLPNVNVGPAFQIVNQSSAGQYSGIQDTYVFAGQIQGTYVDTRAADENDLTSFPVRVFLSQTVIKVLQGAAAGSISGYDLNKFTDATTDVFANIVAGDVIVVTGSAMGNDGNYTVRSKVDNNNLQTNETFAAAESNLTYEIRRNIQNTTGTIEIPTSTSGLVIDAEDGVTLPAGLTYNDNILGNVDIISGTVLLTYRAQRIEESADVFEYTSTSDLQAAFGIDQIVPENIVVFATYLSLLNSVTATNLLECDFNYLNDELMSYANALEVLSRTDMYAISVLTHNPAVHQILKTHVEGYSEPEMKLERVGIINHTLVTTQVVVDDVTTSASEGISGTTDSYFTLQSSASHFLTDGVVPGMFINITAPTVLVGRYKIGAITSQTQLVLAESAPQASNAITFFVDKDLQKSEQASILAAYASSIGSRRMVMTWPDVVKIPVGSEIRPVPGYFLNPAVGALTTGLPTQQGFTNLSVAVYSGVVHSSKYFSSEQLNTIANGGVMIFVQDVLDVTSLYIRHQLTTDRSAIKFQEYSVTKNVDFIAKFIRDNHKQFPGKYNIVDNAFDDLKSNAKAIINFLKDKTIRPKIGGVIKSGKLLYVEQDAANIDTIIERYQLDIPIPLNNLDITIVV